MELVPVGVGAAYGLPDEAQSCYLVRTPERAVVVDLGSGALNRLCALVAPQDLDAVVITHLHPDHCVDLLALRVYMVWGPGAGRRLRVMGPPGLRERLTAFAGSEGWDGVRLRGARVAAAARPTSAAGSCCATARCRTCRPRIAVRLERGGAALCYGADCAPGDELPELAAGCGVLVCECGVRGRAGAGGGAAHARARGRADRRAGRGGASAAHALLARVRPRRRSRGRAGRVRRARGLGPAGRAGRRMTMRRRPPPTRRGLILAVVLSLLLPGLGQAYRGACGAL